MAAFLTFATNRSHMSKGPQKSVHDLADRLVKAIRSTRKDNTDVTTGVIGVNCRNGGPFPANLSWAVDGIERRGPDPISRRLWDRMKVAIGFPSRMP